MLNIVKKYKSVIVRSGVYFILFLVFMLLYNYLITAYTNKSEIYLNIEQNAQTEYQIFYGDGTKDKQFDEENSFKILTDKNNELQKVKVSIEGNDFSKIRIDFGYIDKVKFSLESINIKKGFDKITYEAKEIYEGMDQNISSNNIEIKDIQDGKLYFATTGSDPFIAIDNIIFKTFPGYLSMLIALLASFATTFILYKFVKLRVIYNLFKDLFVNRKLIISLAKTDFKTKYAGSYFGIVWAFVQPLCTILMFWFVFQVGFKSAPIEDVPFVLWLACGLVPWFFFSDAWGSATNSFLDYSYLVKKVVFKISILPIVKVISSLVVHIVFVAFLFLMFSIYKLYPTIYMLQIFYYIFCMSVLVVGLALITSSLIIFFKDLGQIMNIILQFGMWLTPIMWLTDMIPAQFVWIFKLNPMYYIVQGYRDSMLTNILFYQNVKQTLYFWIVTLVILLVGSVLFTKLKPHFADVL